MIVLGILKIIGIILICIIAFILLILILLLVLPFRYKIFAKGHNLNSDLIASIRWFFGIFHLEVSYVEGNFDFFIKLFGKSLSLSGHEKEKPNKEQIKIKEKKSNNKEVIKEGPKVKVRKVKKKKRLTLKDRLINLLNKIKAFFVKVKDIKNFLSEEYTKKAIRHIKGLIINFIKHIFPKKIVGDITFGISDPATTALVYGVFASWAEQTQKGKLLITPDFEENGVFLDLKIYGRLFLGYVLISYLRLILNRDYKKMVDAVRRIF